MREKKLIHWTLNYPTEKDPRPSRILSLACNLLPDDILEYFTTNKILFSAETDICHGGILRLSKKTLKGYTYFLHLSESLWRREDRDIALNIVMQLAHFYLEHDHAPGSEGNASSKQQDIEALKLMNEWIHRRQQNIGAA